MMKAAAAFMDNPDSVQVVRAKLKAPPSSEPKAKDAEKTSKAEKATVKITAIAPQTTASSSAPKSTTAAATEEAAKTKDSQPEKEAGDDVKNGEQAEEDSDFEDDEVVELSELSDTEPGDVSGAENHEANVESKECPEMAAEAETVQVDHQEIKVGEEDTSGGESNH